MVESELFLHTVADLREKLLAKDQYSILRSAALMRQLVLDGKPLIHLANRVHKIRLEFVVSPMEPRNPPLESGMLWWGNDIYPYPFMSGQHLWRTVNLDGLLATDCVRSETQDFTVKDVLKFCANVSGGVHLGQPTDALERELAAIDDVGNIAGLSVSLSALPGIGKVLLAGLQPLIDAVNTEK